MPAKFFQNFLIFLNSDHVTGRRIQSGILRVWPELYIQADGRNHGFGLQAGNAALMTAKGDQREELHKASCYYYNEHFEMLRDSRLHRFFSSCLCLTEFSFLVELCYICLFQRPGSQEQEELLAALLSWKLPIVLVPFCDLGFFESQVPAVGVEPLKLWTFSSLKKICPLGP